jgi:PEP-CTERM motif
MKNLLLSLSAAALLSYQASAQTTISITGTSGSINPTIGSIFGSTITLTISGTPPADVESVNLLLETPTTGANSGVQYFTVSATSGSASFPTLNNPGSVNVMFNTAGDSFNSSRTVSDPGFDLGANIGAGSPVTNSGSDINNLAVDTVTFTVISAPPPGVYDFYATLGPYDSQGTAVFDSEATEFDLSNNPLFSITVTAIPEPSTCLAGVGVLGVIGYTMLRRRATG